MARPEYTVQPNAVETATQYAQDVLRGTIVAGKYVKAACARFIKDLEEQETKPFYFSDQTAQHAVDFFGHLRHTKGVWAREVHTAGFLLAPWQVFIIANLFGWILRDTGLRRFRELYVEVARKNGKSTFIAGIGLYMLFADGEPGAEVYSAATTKEQAKIVFGAAKDMVKVSPYLASRIGAWRNNLHVDSTFSKFEPLAADSGTLDGLNIHCGLIDELHEHPTRALYDVLNTATGARSQPLIASITTAGFDREGICWDQRTYSIKILTNVVPDENFFAFIACLDEGDDAFEERNWIKANPNLGVSVSIEAIRPTAAKAKEQPTALNEFLRKHLNVWTTQDTSWLAAGIWEKNTSATVLDKPEPLRENAYAKLKGRVAFGGLDVAECEDICAYTLVFPPCDKVVHKTVQQGFKVVKVYSTNEIKALPEQNANALLRIGAAEPVALTEIPDKFISNVETIQEADTKWSVLSWFWIPGEYVEQKAKKNRAPYDSWIRSNFLTATPGNSVDQESIRAKILELNNQFHVTEVGYDKWGCEWLGPKLEKDGVKMVSMAPRFEILGNPTKQLTAFLNAGIVEHFNDPVMRWMASNVQLLNDHSGNMRPDKGKSRNKIDGIVSTIMAVGRVLVNPQYKKTSDPNRYAVQYI